MPRVTQISDEARPPLFPKMDCLADIESVDYRAPAGASKATLDINYRLVSDQMIPDPETGDPYPVNGRKVSQRYWLTDAAMWRLEPVLIAAEVPYIKTPIEGAPRQFRYDFETDHFVKKRVIVEVTQESYVAQNVTPERCQCDPPVDHVHSENRVVNRIGRVAKP